MTDRYFAKKCFFKQQTRKIKLRNYEQKHSFKHLDRDVCIVTFLDRDLCILTFFDRNLSILTFYLLKLCLEYLETVF